MTLKEFVDVYIGGQYFSLKGYCEEEYYNFPLLCSRDPECGDPQIPDIMLESWWPKVKDREIKEIGLIGGTDYKTELIIELK